MTIYRNSSLNTLANLSATLRSQGFTVEAIVATENQWVDGNPYIITSATNRDILTALRQ